MKWGVAALAAALLLGAGVFVACQATPRGPGPLQVGEDRTESGGSWDVGTTISFGAPVIRNPTDRVLTIREITLEAESADPGALVSATYVLDLTGITTKTGLGAGFPPVAQTDHAFTPAKGAVLNPGTTYQVLFVVTVDRQGDWAFPSFTVEYETTGRRHRVTVPQGLRVCAPKDAPCGR